MTNIKKTLAAGALAVIMSAGSASAGGLTGNTHSVGTLWNKLSVSKASVQQGAQFIGGTFAVWTFWRFMNNCGPFRC